MAKTIAATTRFRYVTGAMRYRDLTTGKFVAPSTVKRAIQGTIRKARARMRSLALELDARTIRLDAWQRDTAAELKLLHVANAMIGTGGLAAMTPADYGRVGARLRFEYGRLQRFAEQLKAREFTQRAFLARVEMYCNAGGVSYAAAREDAAYTAGMEEERNKLGPREDHCESSPDGSGRPGCLDLTRLGWVPLGTLPAIGARKCLSNCGCDKAFRRRPRSKASVAD